MIVNNGLITHAGVKHLFESTKIVSIEIDDNCLKIINDKNNRLEFHFNDYDYPVKASSILDELLPVEYRIVNAEVKTERT